MTFMVETFSDSPTYILVAFCYLFFQNFSFSKSYTQKTEKTGKKYGKHEFDKIDLVIWS